jgi:hypothetical protein
MMAGYEITCANKNRIGLLVRIGGTNWSLSLQEALTKLLSQEIRFYLMVNGKPTEVGIRGEGTDAYLALEPDGYPLHRITDLQSC